MQLMKIATIAKLDNFTNKLHFFKKQPKLNRQETDGYWFCWVLVTRKLSSKGGMSRALSVREHWREEKKERVKTGSARFTGKPTL